MTSQPQSQTSDVEDPTVSQLLPAPAVAQLMLPTGLPTDSLTTCKSSTIQAPRGHHAAAIPEEARSSRLLGMG